MLNQSELLYWSMCNRKHWSDNPSWFYSQVYDEAVRKIGNVAYRGDAWSQRVSEMARTILAQLGVETEDHCGYLYLFGKRIYWSRDRWAHDDWR